MSREVDFWARRKAGVQAEEQAALAAVEQQELREQHAVLEEQTDAEILADLELPDPDTLKMGDDFSAFMAKAVPDRIRRRALRTLWRSNPVLANVDMLVDYGEDFTDAAMVVENMQTAYQVGKGMLKHVQEMARQAEERDNPPAEEEIEDEGAEEEVLVAETETEDPHETIAFVEEEDDEEPLVAPTPRRMKFTIEESAA
ncbi:MAG: DUF3306 domain-containing protein [Ascidiaceihabitans sp.]|nr:DUF3306 domain-containing protein [Ascidiaceihabitans sp.]